MSWFVSTSAMKRWTCGVGVAALSTFSQSAFAADWYVDNAVTASGNGRQWRDDE